MNFDSGGGIPTITEDDGNDDGNEGVKKARRGYYLSESDDDDDDDDELMSDDIPRSSPRSLFAQCQSVMEVDFSDVMPASFIKGDLLTILGEIRPQHYIKVRIANVVNEQDMNLFDSTCRLERDWLPYS